MTLLGRIANQLPRKFGSVGSTSGVPCKLTVPSTDCFITALVIRSTFYRTRPSARTYFIRSLFTMSSPMRQWSDRMLEVIQWCNSFYSEESSRTQCKPFFIAGQQVGHITPKVLRYLQDRPDVIQVQRDAATSEVARVTLSPALATFEQRTEKMAGLLEDLRKLDVFETLRGWRNEMYAVCVSYHDETLMNMERAATCLFGIKQYGVHLNGYCNHPAKGLCMWIGRRSPTKSTFPNRLDNVAAGGLPSGMPVKDCLVKECAEEASIPECIAKNAVPAGLISYFYEDERGLFDETQFVYDLELPADFVPQINDDEVSKFYLWTLEEVKEKIASKEFKPNCALVILDFLIRKGYLTPDTDPNYVLFLQGLHSDSPTDLFR